MLLSCNSRHAIIARGEIVRMLNRDLLDQVKARAADPNRCNDGAGISGQSLDLGSLLGQLGPAGTQFHAMQSQVSGLMGQFANILSGFGTENPMPKSSVGRTQGPPAAASANQIADAEER